MYFKLEFNVLDMSALDLKLIHEFRLVPALYNRNSARFKDKAYVERAWRSIANKLGHDANILKDRMYQLRNRYNLEKRKMQSLRDEGLTNPKPMWPLYHNLNFLSGHIKQRKSYKMIRSVSSGPGFRGFTKEEGRYRIVRPYSMNRTVEIKEEPVDQMIYDNGNDSVDPDSLMDNTINTSDVQQHTVNKTSQTLQNINRLKQSLLADGCSESTMAQKKIFKKKHHPSHKFEAFGSFVNNSLQDLPQHKALEMIERFTGEIVQALTYHRMESSNS